ncbi:MAG: DUF1993 domain-containing protein [Erythrobacter sp.]
MPLSLHAAFVPSCEQLLGGMRGIIDKAETYAKDSGIGDTALIEAKLADDMWTLPWHVRACWVHSAMIIDLLPSGAFSPDFTDIPDSWDAMRAMTDDALAKLAKVTDADLEQYEDDVIGFELGGKRLMELTGSNFLLSFSQPQFYFHATTFYDILRHKGMPLGKRDYTGIPRVIGG